MASMKPTCILGNSSFFSLFIISFEKITKYMENSTKMDKIYNKLLTQRDVCHYVIFIMQMFYLNGNNSAVNCENNSNLMSHDWILISQTTLWNNTIFTLCSCTKFFMYFIQPVIFVKCFFFFWIWKRSWHFTT